MLALLFPIDWQERFGLVMIEALSAGTPVIAWREGSVSEVIEDDCGGFGVDTIDEAVAAIGRTRSLSRREVRRSFESRFTVARMASDYVAAYERMATFRPLAEVVDLRTARRSASALSREIVANVPTWTAPATGRPYEDIDVGT